MTRPWLLVIAAGVTVGGLFGVPGVIVWTGAVVLLNVAQRRSWALLALAGLLAAASGAARVALDAPPDISPVVLASSQADGVVHTLPQRGPSGPRAVFRVQRVREGRSPWTEERGDVLVLFGQHAPENLAKGDRLRLVWAVTGLDEYDPEFRRFVRATDASAGAWAFHATVLDRGNDPTAVLIRTRDLVTDRIQAAIPGDAGALIAGFVTGDDSGLSDATQAAFERTNMSHITAVSGSNVAVLLGIWFFLIPSRRLQRSWTALLTVATLVWLYVLLVGMGPGAVRAGLFVSIMLPAARFGRRADPLTALMLASGIMLLVRPGFSGNVGFWLSLAASTAMVVSVDRTQKERGGLLVQGLIALVAAQVATLPITVWIFDSWSPASLITNLIVGPIVSMFFPFAFLAAILLTIMPWLGAMIGWLPALGASVIIAIVESMAGNFTLIRTGTMPTIGIVLIAVLSLAVIVVIGADSQRWIRRVEWARPGVARIIIPVALGAGTGFWIAIIAFAMIR